jgi:hypothetical protein
MPPIERSDLKQTAVLWAATADEYDNYGKLKVASPTAINVRWEYRRGETLDTQGTTVAYDAVVIVDQEIEVGSIMWLGTVSDYENTSPAPTVYRVVTYGSTPDIKAQYYRRRVTLAKYGTQLPELIS